MAGNDFERNWVLITLVFQSLKDLDYVVRERTILEWILDMELELSAISDGKN